MLKSWQNKKIINLLVLLPFILVGIIYFRWVYFAGTVSSGDWPYLFSETIATLPWIPQGQFLWLDTYYHVAAKLGVQVLGLPWEVTEKLFWFFPFLIISLVCSWIFVYRLLGTREDKQLRNVLAAIGSLIYASNSYILMIVGGGQMGVGLAYALAPLVLSSIITLRSASSFNIKTVLTMGIICAVQLMFDPRLFVLTVLAGVVIVGIEIINKKTEIPLFLTKLGAALAGAIAVNSFWIIPNAVSYKGLYEAATNGDVVSFLSFATFSNAISLTHPNWPENIFGKIGFMKPEFLILPILAFAGLLFIRRKQKNDLYIISFSIIALLGIFLSKGTNEPFGIVYRMLAKIPGFMIFRDPTKFYLLIALSYSILIPYTLGQLVTIKRRKGLGLGILSIFLFLWVLIHRQGFLGQLRGTFTPRIVPKEYVVLKDFLLSQDGDFVTLWVPKHQRFGYSSYTQKAMNSQDEIADVSPREFAAAIATEGGKMMIQSRDIRFFIIPFDSEGEIFLTDHRYDGLKRHAWEEWLDRVVWLEKITLPDAETIAIYKVIQ